MSDSPEDDTIRVRRSWSGRPPSADAADEELDEVTAVSRRKGPADHASADIDDATPEDGGHEQPVRHRSTYIDGPPSEEAEQENGHDDHPDGSTIVARRESRRRASRDPDDAQAGSRTADGAAADSDHVPPVASNEVYPVRAPAHIIAEHLDRGVRTPQAPVDGDRAAAERRRAARRATVIVVTTASIVVISAAAALIGIVLSL